MMKQWVVGITAASLLAAIAMALTPPGRVRQVTRLVCGLMCALAVAGPVVKLDFRSIAAGIAVYEQRAEAITARAEQEAKMLDRTYIEDRYGAYILAKAVEAGVAVQSASVTARWDETDLVWYPWTASVDAPFDSGLAAAI